VTAKKFADLLQIESVRGLIGSHFSDREIARMQAKTSTKKCSDGQGKDSKFK
jgi:hypothetical protein